MIGDKTVHYILDRAAQGRECRQTGRQHTPDAEVAGPPSRPAACGGLNRCGPHAAPSTCGQRRERPCACTLRVRFGARNRPLREQAGRPLGEVGVGVMAAKVGFGFAVDQRSGGHAQLLPQYAVRVRACHAAEAVEGEAEVVPRKKRLVRRRTEPFKLAWSDVPRSQRATLHKWCRSSSEMPLLHLPAMLSESIAIATIGWVLSAEPDSLPVSKERTRSVCGGGCGAFATSVAARQSERLRKATAALLLLVGGKRHNAANCTLMDAKSNIGRSSFR